MYDYRRNEKDDQKSNLLDKTRNIAAIAIVGTAGMAYMRRTSNIIAKVEEANAELLKRERANLEDIRPAITRDHLDLWKVPEEAPIDNILKPTDFKNYDLSYDPFRLPENESISESLYKQSDEEPIRDKHPIFKHVLEQELLSDEEYSKLLSAETATFSKAREKLEKKYAGFAGKLLENNIHIVHVKESTGYSKTFDMIIEHTDENTGSKKRTKISLPNYVNGYIREASRDWIHSPGALSDGTKVIIPRFDRSFMTKFNKKIDNLSKALAKSTKDPVSLVSKYVTDAKNELFQTEGVINTVSAHHGIGGYSFVNVKALPYIEMARYDKGAMDEAMRFAGQIEGLPIYTVGAMPSKDEQFIFTHEYASVTGGSETSYSDHARMFSRPKLQQGPMPDVFKQSNFRQNVSKGWGVIKSRDKWITQFGIISSTYLDRLETEDVHGNMVPTFQENYTGRVSSTGFYFSPEKDIFDGAAVYVDQVVNGKPRAFDHTGRYTNPYTVKRTDFKNKKQAYGITQDIYDKWHAGEPVYINKGAIIGINPGDNKPIVARESGIITALEADVTGDRLNIQISSNAYMGKGAKIVQTKEVVDRSLDNTNIDTIFLEEDRKMANALLKVDGKLGLEYLMNGSSIKRYMNGAASMGFMHKVLSDIVELKRDEILKHKGDPEKIAVLKNNMQKFARDYITYQMGPEANAGIARIVIDDDLQVGLELHPEHDPSSHIFHKGLELESLIKHGERTNNWDGFADKMEAIQKFIREHENGAVDYEVVTYVKHLENRTKQQPRYVSAAIMTGEAGNPGSLLHLNLNLTTATHSVSNINLAKTAGLRWNSRGFIGGTKMAAEMRRNFVSLGMKGMTSYVDFLQDFRMNYLLDKTKTQDMFLLDSKKVAANGNTITIGDRKVNVHTRTFMLDNPDNLLGRLQTEIDIGEKLRLNHSIRMARNNLDNLHGLTNTEILDKIATNNLLSIEELTEANKAGIGGNSLSLITRDLLHDLVKLTKNESPSKKAIYMKLPFEISFSDQQKGDLVSLINFDQEDSFAIEAARFTDPDKLAAGSSVLRECYTMSGFGHEYIEYMQKVANVTEEWNKTAEGDSHRAELVSYLTDETKLLLSKMQALTSTKHSSYIQNTHQGRAPFSAQGEMKGAISLKVGELGVTTDRMTQILTGNTSKSMAELESKVRIMEEFRSFANNEKVLLDEFDYKGDFKHNKARKKVAKYRKTISKIARQLPEGGTTLSKIEELFDIMNKGLDELGQKDMIGKKDEVLARIRNDSRAGIDAIIKMTSSEHIRNSNMLATLNEWNTGNVDIYGRAERFPIIGINAGSFTRVVPYNPEGVNAKDYIKSEVERYKKLGVSDPKLLKDIAEKARQEARKTHDYMYMNQVSMKSHHGDFDRDFMSISISTFDTIKTIWEKNMDALNISALEHKEFIGKDIQYRLLNFQAGKEMTIDTIRGFIEKNTVLEPVEKGLHYRPANLQSSMMVDVINNAKYLDSASSIKSVQLREGIEQVVEKTMVSMDTARKKELVESLLLQANKKVANLYPNIDFKGRNELKFITDVNYVNYHPEKEYKDHIKLINPYPGRMSFDEIMEHEKSSLATKEAFTAYNKAVEEQYIGRFGEMKLDTATAYRAGEGLNRLAENMHLDETQKKFMSQLADHITQTTISIKHGTPSYLHFFKEAIKQIEQSKGGDISTIQRLSEGNIILKFPGFQKEMMQYGFLENANSQIDFETFENYLKEKEAFTKVLRDAHESAIIDKQNNYKQGVTSPEIIKDNYRAIVKGHVDAHTIVGSVREVKGSDVFEDYMYSHDVVNHMINSTVESRMNASKARKAFARGDYTLDNWTRLSLDLKTSYEKTGHSVFEDPSERIRTAFVSYVGQENAVMQMENLHNTMQYAKSIENNHSAKTSAMRVAAAWYNEEITQRMADSLNENAVREKVLQSQTRSIRRKILQREAGNIPTVFYSGSVVDKLTGGKHLPAVETPHGMSLARKSGNAKLAAIGIGFLAGAFIGQSLNMLAGDDAVPGVSPQGLGGEYYEHAGMFGKNITGREMEIFLREKPVKLASGFSHWNNELKYQTAVQNITDSNIERDNPRYRSSFKGVMVR